MNIKEISLSNKYAEAFLNLFIDKLTSADYQNLLRASAFLNQNPKLIACFNLPQLQEVKQKVLAAFFEEFVLPTILKKLTDLLVRDQRLFLLPEVFNQLIELYRKEKGIMAFEVKSSSRLTDEQLESIIKSLAAKTGNKIEYNYQVDNALIAGLRLQSTTLLWERSIAQQLNEARHILSS